jgi:hypothetical protein
LRDALKLELQQGHMKLAKPFVKTCYSEALVSDSSAVAENEHEDGSLINNVPTGSAGQDITYHGGLGLRFKFPGDPKKSVAVGIGRTHLLIDEQAPRGLKDKAMDSIPQKYALFIPPSLLG